VPPSSLSLVSYMLSCLLCSFRSDLLAFCVFFVLLCCACRLLVICLLCLGHGISSIVIPLPQLRRCCTRCL